MAGDDWSRGEVEATVADYFAMLRDELAGLRVSKAEHNERLRRLLRSRSKGSVEFKHANISAVLTLHGYPYIDGYKPRFNFQALLEQVVLEYLDLHRVVEPPPEDMRIPQTVWSPSARIGRFDFVARDAANRDLGRRGEEFVLEFERKRLHDGGRRDLVPRIEWTSKIRGDGAGYDVQSFNADGTSRLVEVKTTGLGKYFPFNVTVNEVRCSQARPDEFHLYRVFHFGPDAHLYMLPGELSKSCRLDATQYRAFVHASGQRSSHE
jgi:Protein NO VEIN, C-terminal